MMRNVLAGEEFPIHEGGFIGRLHSAGSDFHYCMLI
jgi:hypothetical protein